MLTLGQIILLEYALVWIYKSLNNHEDQTKVKEDNLPLLKNDSLNQLENSEHSK
jgi:hypothetical protein